MKKDVITFKGSREGLLLMCDEEAPWDLILESLQKKLQGKEGFFFEGASVIINTGNRVLDGDEVSALWKIFMEKGISVKVIKSGTERELAENTPSGGTNKELSQLPTLTVKRNIRSGQDITFSGNVVIIGDVNPGAELRAAGFIMVLGDLRGTVHAGATGDQEAWVAALRLQPTQLRIADHITRAPDEEPLEPEIAQIVDGIIVVRQLRESTVTTSIGGIK